MPSVFLLFLQHANDSKPNINMNKHEYSKTLGPQLSKSRCAKVLGAASAGGHGEHGVVAAEPHWEVFHEIPPLGEADFCSILLLPEEFYKPL